jgi:hypothetical protein
MAAERLVFGRFNRRVQLLCYTGAHLLGGHIGKGDDEYAPDIRAGSGIRDGIDATGR